MPISMISKSSVCYLSSNSRYNILDNPSSLFQFYFYVFGYKVR